MPESNYGQIKNINARQKKTHACLGQEEHKLFSTETGTYLFPCPRERNPTLVWLEKAAFLTPYELQKTNNTVMPM